MLVSKIKVTADNSGSMYGNVTQVKNFLNSLRGIFPFECSFFDDGYKFNADPDRFGINMGFFTRYY